MAEILSRSEIELLLSALHPHPIVEPAPEDSTGNAAESPLAGTTAWEERASELVRAAVVFSERFRTGFESALRTFLDSPAALRRFMPRRVSLRQFLEHPSPRPLWIVLEAEESTGDLVLAIDADLATALVRRGLGFSPSETTDTETRGWTELDGRLLRRLVREACGSMSPHAGSRVLGLENAMEVVDGVEHFAAWNSQDAWWVEHWELRTPEIRGQIRFASPWQLHARHAGTRNSPGESVLKTVTISSPRLDREGRKIVAELARIESTPEQLTLLRVGDVVVTDQDADSPVRVTVENGEIWEGIAGTRSGKKAVRLTRRGVLCEPRE